MQKRTLLDGKKFQITIKRLCHQLIENHNDFSNTVLIGIQPRGSYFADRVKQELAGILKNQTIKRVILILLFSGMISEGKTRSFRQAAIL